MGLNAVQKTNVDEGLKKATGGGMILEGGVFKSSSVVEKTPINFVKTISRPSTNNSKGKGKEVCLSNSFAHIGLEDTDVEEVTLRSPVTFLDVFEQAISSKDRGKLKVGVNEGHGYEDSSVEYKGLQQVP